jgi:hypothetical protein
MNANECGFDLLSVFISENLRPDCFYLKYKDGTK